MSLLSYTRLIELVEQGVINAKPENVNGASIDITLHKDLLVEKSDTSQLPLEDLTIKQLLLNSRDQFHGYVDLKKKESLEYVPVTCGEYGFSMAPSQFLLASSEEVFNLPNNIACEFKLKSSLARSGLQHLLAGWCDPGWTNSRLTLELKNVTQYNNLLLREGMKIGQIIFFECEPVPEENSYSVKGQYNNQKSVTNSKGLK